MVDNPMLEREHRAHRILVVDDELIIRETVKRVLVLDGHTVETAATGREALCLFEQDKFDLVILDYEMPDMKGDELSLLIKALAPNQSIAILTGYREAVRNQMDCNAETFFDVRHAGLGCGKPLILSTKHDFFKF
jgi:CheY-like chemotaxis protein